VVFKTPWASAPVNRVLRYHWGMLLESSGFTPLEKAVLDGICAAYLGDQPSLRAQLATAAVKNRENTGCGFFTHFVVDLDSASPLQGDRYRDGGSAKIEPLKHGMGFILFLKKGYADCLEGYSYANESTANPDFADVNFEITGPPNANQVIWRSPDVPHM
jgi:hypothetical protein